MIRQTVDFMLSNERGIKMGFHESVEVDWADVREMGEPGWVVRGVEAPWCQYDAPFEADTVTAVLSWLIKRMTSKGEQPE